MSDIYIKLCKKEVKITDNLQNKVTPI